MRKLASTTNSDPITKTREMSMSSKPKRIESTEPKAINIQAAETGEASLGNGRRHEEIRLRAYEIYLERGQQSRCELDDWLQAERELQPGVLSRAQAG